MCLLLCFRQQVGPATPLQYRHIKRIKRLQCQVNYIIKNIRTVTLVEY